MENHLGPFQRPQIDRNLKNSLLFSTAPPPMFLPVLKPALLPTVPGCPTARAPHPSPCLGTSPAEVRVQVTLLTFLPCSGTSNIPNFVCHLLTFGQFGPSPDMTLPGTISSREIRVIGAGVISLTSAVLMIGGIIHSSLYLLHEVLLDLLQPVQSVLALQAHLGPLKMVPNDFP